MATVSLLLASAAFVPRPAGAGRAPRRQEAPEPARAENLQILVRGGVVEITYDLRGGDRESFSIQLDVSPDGGKTWQFVAKSITGDVGAGVAQGSGKRIVWEAAKDVEALDLEQFRFRIVIEGTTGGTGTEGSGSVRAKGGRRIWIIPLVAAGAAGAVVAAAGSGKDSTPATPAPPPNRDPVALLTIDTGGATPIATLTTVSFSAGGSSDPDGDTLTYVWNFGDGNQATGVTATHAYSSSGTFTVTLTTSDGKGGSATATSSVTVRSMSGTWVNTYQGSTRTFVMTQSGTALSGTYTNSNIPRPGTLSGSLSAPRGISIRAQIPDELAIFMTNGLISNEVNSLTGEVSGGTFPRGLVLTFVRQ